MKSLIIIACIAVFSCCSSKNSTANKTVIAGQPSTRVNDSLPACVQTMIDKYKVEEKQNPPRQIFSYYYNNATVYYVTPPCCDFFSELYDSKCNLIAQPDGGITGKGDGRAPDFLSTRKNEKLIWKDERK